MYNDPAIAISWLLAAGAERVAYVDIDVHHADGVQAAFYDSPRVLTISLHEHPATALFPGTGLPSETGGPGARGSAVNVALPAGTADAGWLRAFDAVVPPLLRAFRPQILVSQHGCDSHWLDPLAGLRLSIDALQAAVIIGSGSASFEMLRYLTERLPAMVTPRWVDTRIQPIAVHDVLRYLAGSATLPAEVSRRFDIGGPDVLTYAEMMRRYAEVAGLTPRVIVKVPVLTPRLSSLWVGLVTPVPANLARPLVESLRNEVVCSEHDIAGYIPDPPEGLLTLDQAITAALRYTREGAVSTRWTSAATPGAPSDPLPTDPSWAGGSLYVDARNSVVRASPAALWRVIEGIGGQTGWYSFPAAWAVRGLLDRLAGGVGLRRGRRDPRHLLAGDALDFWRVEAIEPGKLLRLRAEMKLPGLAWLELSVGQDYDGMTTYSQRAIFRPRGLAGHAYWRSISPFHGVVFGGMLRNITAAAERAERAGGTPRPHLA